MGYYDEYYCPHCGAVLNDQPGFDPDNGTWECTECGEMLMDDDIYNGDTYEGVAWFCDNCEALLNRQPGFTDSEGSWVCTVCGHYNSITDNDIDRSEFTCPNCGATLDDQLCFNKYADDWECTSCSAHLHHEYCDEAYTIVEGPQNVCPNCGADLDQQTCYSEYEDDWDCTECGKHLHRDYCDDDYTVVENAHDTCPNCDTDLTQQAGYYEFVIDWECSECHVLLHRDNSDEGYSVVDQTNTRETDETTHTSKTKAADNSFNAYSNGDSYRTSYRPGGYETFGGHQYQTYTEPHYSSQRSTPYANETDETTHTSKTKTAENSFNGYSSWDSYRTSYRPGGFETFGGHRYQTYTEPHYSTQRSTTYTKGTAASYDPHHSTEPILHEKDPSTTDKGKNTKKPSTIRTCGTLFLATLLIFAALAVIIWSASLMTSQTKSQQQPILLSVPFASEEVKGRPYNEIEDELRSAGFTDIEFKVLYDVILNIFEHPNATESVSIDGDTDYSHTDSYKPNTKVIITYHDWLTHRP